MKTLEDDEADIRHTAGRDDDDPTVVTALTSTPCGLHKTIGTGSKLFSNSIFGRPLFAL